MTNKIQTIVNIVAGSVPAVNTIAVGQLAVNLTDKQFGFGEATGPDVGISTPTQYNPLLAIRLHSALATYALDDLVKEGGSIYKCIVPHTAQAFSLTNFLSIVSESTGYWEAATGGINYPGGNVGINTISPDKKLEVFGDARISQSTTYPTLDLIIKDVPGDTWTLGRIIFKAYSSGAVENYGAGIAGVSEGQWTSSSAPTGISFNTTAVGSLAQVEVMRLANNAKVGIGTIDPDEKLEVVGNILATNGYVHSELSGSGWTHSFKQSGVTTQSGFYNSSGNAELYLRDSDSANQVYLNTVGDSYILGDLALGAYVVCLLLETHIQ